ncbi:MAG: hypothetical protein QME68_07275, partial [Elusimicrobiota bacterium]|nr:hypothetical protein [Elusimicrobiota bacterium]
HGVFSYNIWPGHSDKSYLKIKFFLSTDISPVSPQINELQIVYNIRPNKPQLLSPPHKKLPPYYRINRLTPEFEWYKSADNDNDTLTYRLQVSSFSDFLLYYEKTNIPDTTPTVKCTLTDPLFEKNWYWRVYAKDTSTGPWSEV